MHVNIRLILSQQITTEMQDIRSHIPQPQTYEHQPTENPQLARKPGFKKRSQGKRGREEKGPA